MPSEHPNFISMPGMHGSYAANMAMTNADLLIALGVRFDDRVTGRLAAFAPHAKVIHVDIDPAEVGKNRTPDVPIVGDVKRVLTRLNKLLEDGRPAPSEKNAAARRAFVADGLAYNWTIQRGYFPDFVPIVDFLHVVCYLYAAAHAVAPEESQHWAQYVLWVRACWQGRVRRAFAD